MRRSNTGAGAHRACAERLGSGGSGAVELKWGGQRKRGLLADMKKPLPAESGLLESERQEPAAGGYLMSWIPIASPLPIVPAPTGPAVMNRTK